MALSAVKSGLAGWRFAEALPFPVWFTNRDGVTTYANPVLAGMLGSGVGPRVEDGWIRAVCPDDRSRALADWESARRSMTAIDLEVGLIYAHEQRVAAWRVRLRPVSTRPGTVQWWIGSACDIQSLRETLAELKEARERLASFREIERELLLTLAHDLRTPLNAMLGWTRLLKSQPLSIGVAEHGLGVLERQIELQADLTNEIADVASMLERHDDAGLLGKSTGSARDHVKRLRNLARQTREETSPEPPSARRPGLELAPSISEGTAGTLSRVTALIVEDDPHEALLLVHALESAGAEVHRESSVLTALEAIRALLPDVVLANVHLPMVDGWTFIRQIRTWSPHKGGNIPAVALGASPDDRARSLREGFQQYLVRPVSSVQIVSIVAELVGRAS